MESSTAKQRLKIWLLKAGEPLPLNSLERTDEPLLRTGLLARELVRRGHDVTWWTSSFDHRKKAFIAEEGVRTTIEGLKLVLMKGCGYSRNISLKRFIDHRQLAAKFREMAPSFEKPDVIIASLPPYDVAREAVRFARARGIPVVVDLRDEWPDLFVKKLPAPLRPLGRLALANEFKIASEAIHDATALTAMMESMLTWGLGYAKRERTKNDRVFYLGAETPKPVEALSPRLSELKSQVEGTMVVTYIGTFGAFSDPRFALESARELAAESKQNPSAPKVSFVFAGHGPLLDEMKESAQDLKHVHFPGWMSAHEMDELLSFTHYGLVPNTQVRDALPNKAISYFSRGVPVLNFFQGEIETLIRDEKLGASFAPADAKGLLQYLKHASVDSEEYRSMGDHARRVFAERFSSEGVYGAFADYLECLSLGPNLQ